MTAGCATRPTSCPWSQFSLLRSRRPSARWRAPRPRSCPLAATVPIVLDCVVARLDTPAQRDVVGAASLDCSPSSASTLGLGLARPIVSSGAVARVVSRSWSPLTAVPAARPLEGQPDLQGALKDHQSGVARLCAPLEGYQEAPISENVGWNGAGGIKSIAVGARARFHGAEQHARAWATSEPQRVDAMGCSEAESRRGG